MNILIIIGVLVVVSLIWYFTKPKKERIYKHFNTRNWTSKEENLLKLVNDLRKSYELVELQKDNFAYQLAEIRFYEIIQEYKETKKITHDIEMITIAAQSNGGTLARENLGLTYYNEETCFQAWKESPKHLGTILGNFKYTGIAVGEKDGRKFYVQVFVL